MNSFVTFALLISLTAQGAFAQSYTATAPRYVPSYVQKQSQLDAMNARPADAAYGADSASAPRALNRYVLPSLNLYSQKSREKRALQRLPNPANAAAPQAPADSYSNDLWNTDQNNASPLITDPYSTR
jgi:hypothetical protein